MRTRNPKLVVLALAAVLSLPLAVHATVLVEVPIDDMAYVADAIVLGRVDRVGTRLELSGPAPMPWTVSTIRVERWIHGGGGGRGGSGSEVAIEELGGEWQDTRVVVAGTPTYQPGDRVLVFLRRDDKGRYRTYGMAQGKFMIQASVEGVTTATRDLGDIAFATWANGAMQVEHLDEHGNDHAMPLAELVARIEQVLTVRP